MENILKLSQVKKELPFNISKGTCLCNIKDLITDSEYYNLDFDVFLPTKNKNLQRDYCWSNTQKSELILSILKGIQIPVFYFVQSKAKDGARTYKVIDGKQRLSTILSFVRGEFFVVHDDCAYSFENLDAECQQKIMLYDITVNIAYEYYDKPISDNDLIAWFELINFAGTQQDIQHLINLKS